MQGGTISNNISNYRGGGIFLKKTPTLNSGVIAGNKAKDEGGGLCINGDKLELKSDELLIYGNTAKNGGGVAVLNGEFIIDGGNVGITADTPMPIAEVGNELSVDSIANVATENGGGVYVAAENSTANTGVTVKKGQIWHNEAKNGGGVYLAKGIFTMNSNEAIISQNHAKENGGGIYLLTDPNLQAGQIALNMADKNGGGMYIDGCMVNLEPSGTVNIARNRAKNGGGIYIHGVRYVSEHPDNTGGSTDPAGEAVQLDATTTPTPANDTGLKIHDASGNLTFAENEAIESGGAICIEKGGCELSSEKISVVANNAKNGGGVAVLNGNFTMTKGSIGAEGTLDTSEGPISNANTASNGGGVYVSDGDVWLLGGKIQYNKAELDSESGATGGSSGNTRRTGNGGGIYVSEGDINVVYSTIEYNTADWDGGGFFVSALTKDVNVVMLSGSLCHNVAKNSGGGMAVESDPTNPKKINVEIGCLLNHNVSIDSHGQPIYPVEYTGNYEQYKVHALEYISEKCEHQSCPQVKGNRAVTYGGGFYMNSKESTLTFYCINESDNIATSKESTEGLDIEGGRVIIGDVEYHNNKHDASGEGSKLIYPRGYIIMDNATLVIGGQVDIYGDMANPTFKDPVTVDIQDKINDRFFDHRRIRDGAKKRYKVHYIENFKGTGLYNAYDYDEDHTLITIKGALYSHPGYRILGWYTAAEYNPLTDGAEQKFYPVGEQFDLSKKESVPHLGNQSIDGCDICTKDITTDKTLLKLYAIWEPNGYTVHFDPNPPQEAETYTGSMEDQIFTYQEEGNKTSLNENGFHIDGYIFTKWARNPEGTGDTFTDEQEVGNLTTENGDIITLYAIWEKCNHTDPHRWSYRVDPNNPSTLIRDCSCGGQTLRATLYADNTVYDGLTHPATLICDSEWGDDMPVIEYTSKWLENRIHHTTEVPALSSDNKPFHAGEYMATIKKQNTNADGTKSDVTVNISYIIAKADQPAPVKPNYNTDLDNPTELTIKKDENQNEQILKDEANREHTARAEYRLAYYSGGEQNFSDWQKIPNDSEKLILDLKYDGGFAYTNYYVDARYEELEDYNASAPSRADAVYYYDGQVVLKIICDVGIHFERSTPDGSTDTRLTNGLILTLSTEPDYYLVNGDYNVSATLEHDSTTQPHNYTKDSNDKYRFDGIPDNSILTITIGKARRKPVTAAQLTPGQVFRAFSGSAATISRDSAFTAAFQITNFDPYVLKEDNTAQGVYSEPVLKFSSNIPEKATIILLDRSNNSYWYYTAGSGGAVEVPLTEFKKMGGTETYTVPIPSQTDRQIYYTNLSYQFIVDFSQCEAGFVENSLTLTLEAAVNSSLSTVATIPPVKQEVTVTMADSGFSLTKTSTDESLTQSLEAKFTAGGTVASKWEKRSSTLILTPKDVTTLPPDARIKAVVDGRTSYIHNSGNKFIVPMSLLKSGDSGQKVTLTLQSSLFPTTGASYEFDAEWLISRSKADKSPMNGDGAGTQVVTFVSGAIKPTSLKPSSDIRVLTSKDKLNLDVQWMNMDKYLITATLQQKGDGENSGYNDIGWTSPDFNEGSQANDAKTIGVPLGSCSPGSYRIMLTVKSSDPDAVTIIMRVPYYFVVKE